MERLQGVLRDYHWGDPSYIPQLLGLPVDGTPYAELWLGAYQSAPSTLELSGLTLDRAVKQDPVGILGAPVGEFPVLMKVLAAGGPLSIQVHPDADQARRGFAAEQGEGLELDATTRSYRDPNPKPEVICALTPFSAKCGVRPLAGTEDLLDRLDVPSLQPLGSVLFGAGEASARVHAGLEWLFGLDNQSAGELVSQTVSAAAARMREGDVGRFAPELHWTAQLAQTYPGDIGIVVALLLNHVVLQPGQALFLPPGNVHSYLQGVGVEVMAPSDNVIRGGLTSKHIDVDELLAVLDPCPAVPEVQDAGEGWHAYRVPDAGFGMSRIELDAVRDLEVTGPGVLLSAADGSARLECSTKVLQVHPGQSVLIRADDGAVRVAGSGVVHWAHGTAPATK